MENLFDHTDNSQSHSASDEHIAEKGKGPQGKEGNPNQRVNSPDKLNDDQTNLDRRSADVVNGDADTGGDANESAVPGVQSDMQNSSSTTSSPSGEDPNHNAEVENKEDKEE
jgi:hypothetical protein